MIGTILIALSGLRGYEQGLRVIANNTANMNTPGFKGGTLQFVDLYSASGGNGGGSAGGLGQPGYGLGTLGTMLDMDQGQMQNTGNPLDAAVDGLGMFVLRDEGGHLHYTRDGQFIFNENGKLVSATTGEEVLAFDANGSLNPMTIAVLGTNPAAATKNVVLKGNLSSTVTSRTISVMITDRLGTSHTLSVKLDGVAGSPGTWDVTVLDGTTTVGTGQIAFVNGKADPTRSSVTVTYSLSGQADMPLTFDFSGATSFDSGSQSTLALSTQDGHAQGTLTSATFDADGVLKLGYSNGQTVDGPQLVLARFKSVDAIRPVGNNEFESKDGTPWQTGVAGKDGFGVMHAGEVEVSNVDLSQEFTNLVIMQRGFQSCSQVVSTANEMLAELFNMRGK